jgi:thiol:disulfide interchange protein DsbD
MLWTLLGIFAGGIALNLTPCIYPLIPITVSYFGGQSARGQKKLVIHGTCYIGGLATTNSALAVIAAMTGGLLGSLLQNPIVLVLVAAILIFFASSLFGFWEIRLPYGLSQAASKTYSGYFGSLFIGMTLGVVASACIGPFILGLLTWVATIGSIWIAFLIFFTLSLGLGLPLFVLALFSGQLSKLPRSGEWMLWVKKLLGWILVGMAVYFIQPLLPETAKVVLLAAVALAAALHLSWIDRSRAEFCGFEWLRTVTAIAGLIFATVLIGSWMMRGPGVTWHPYSEQVLAEAQRQQYNVKGVPTVVFLDRPGKERRNLRLVDYLPADQFLIRMAEIKYR